MSALPEVQSSREEHTLRHHDDATTLLGSLVDDALQGLRLHRQRVVATHSIVGHQPLASQLADVDASGVGEPCFHACAVGPCGSYWLLFLFSLQSRREHHEQA